MHSNVRDRGGPTFSSPAGTTAAAATAGRRRDIQVLRGIAVLLVVLFHLRLPGLSGGFVGVDVFFVISGYLVGGTLAREVVENGKIRFREFYARRARRIVPAAMLTIAVTAVASALLNPASMRLAGPGAGGDAVATDGLSAILYVPNLWFMNEGRDYGADSAASPYLHFWSLGVEEQFYIVAPFVLVALWALARGRFKILALAIGTLGVGSFAYAMLLPGSDGNIGYFDPLGRAWELVIGLGVAMVVARGISVKRVAVATALAWVGVAGIFASAVAVNGEFGWPRWTAIGVTGATALALFAGHAAARPPRALQPLEWVGDRSYSWYLWHWPMIVLATHVVGHGLGVRSLAIVAAASVVASHLSFVLIERPANNWAVDTSAAQRRVFVRTGSAMVLAIVVTVGAGVFATARVAPTELGPDVEPPDPFVAASSATAPTSVEPAPALAPSYVSPDLDDPLLEFEWVTPSNITPVPAKAARDLPVGALGVCNAKQEQRLDDIPPCALGSGPTTVMLFGDSHARHWISALEPWVDAGDITLVPITASGCWPFPTSRDEISPGCDVWRAHAIERMNSVAPDIIVVAAKYHEPRGGDAAFADFVSQIAPFAAELPEGTDFAFVLDTPTLPQRMDRCAPAHAADLRACASKPAHVLWPAQERAVADAVISAGGTAVDMNPYICNTDVCGLVVGNVFVYRDGDHLTSTYMRLLAEPFGAALGLGDRRSATSP